MTRESEIWQEMVYLTDCPHCEARQIFDADPRGAEVHPIKCNACGKTYNGIFPEDTGG